MLGKSQIIRATWTFLTLVLQPSPISLARVRNPVLLFGLLILVACGGAGTPGGVLRVRVIGLPTGTAAVVKVIGADQSERTVTADTDLKLPPGDYVVRGLAVGSGEKDAPAYSPAVATQSVTVGSGAGASVQVEYQPVVTKISPETRVADDTASAALTSLVRDSGGRTTLTFAGGNPQITALKTGEILVLGPSAAAPEGHFGRVVSNDGTTVVTEPAAMQEVVQQGAFILNRTLVLDGQGVALPQGVRPSGVSTCLDVNRTLDAAAGTGGVAAGLKVTVSGTLCLSIDVSFNMTYYPIKLVNGKLVQPPPDIYLNSKVSTTSPDGRKTSLRVSASALVATPVGEAPFEFPEIAISLPEYKFSPITVFTGPVPWVITPFIALDVGAGGTVTAGVKFGMDSEGSVEGGFSYDSNSNRTTTSSKRELSFTPIWPVFNSTLSFKAFIEPSVGFYVYGVAGPFLGLQPYVRFKTDFGPPISWQLYGGIGLSTGLTTAFKGVPPFSYTLYNYEAQILSSRQTPPPGQTTGNAPGFDASGGLVVGPDDTVYVGSGNSVRAYPYALAPKWTYNTSGNVQGLSRGDDGTIYAWDFGGTLYAINPDGTQKWKTNPLGNLEIRRVALTANGLVVTAGGNTVRTFSAANGAPGWSDDVGESVYSVVVDKSGNIWSNGSSSVRKHAPTGGVLATVAAPSSPGGMAIAPDGTVYVRSSSILSAVAPSATVKWSNAIPLGDEWSAPAIGPDGTVYLCGTPPQDRLYAVNPTNGSEKWSYWHNEICKATPAIGDNGLVYIITDKSLRAINASNGALAWHVAAGNNDTKSSPVFLTNKSVVAGTSTGLISVYAGGQLATGTWSREGGDANGSGRMR